MAEAGSTILELYEGKYFVVPINITDPMEVKEKLDYYKEREWIDKFTKRVQIDYFVFNGESGLFALVSIRFNLIEMIEDREINLPNIIHPSAVISKMASASLLPETLKP